MSDFPKKLINIFGATGSIGRQTTEIILKLRENPKVDRYQFDVNILAGHKNPHALYALALNLKPKIIAISRTHIEELYALIGKASPFEVTGLEDLIYSSSDQVDITVMAIAGFGALKFIPWCISHSRRLAMANKEAIIALGSKLFDMLEKSGTELIPIDSEHNTIWQLIGGCKKFEKITLTASGGPFLGKDSDFLKNATPQQALHHPKWNMGAKISIDSATTANKALEIIEAHYLFSTTNIEVLIHPQSIVHAIVTLESGINVMGASNPDMRFHISHALLYPHSYPDWHRMEPLNLFIEPLKFLTSNHAPFPFIELAQGIVQHAPHKGIVLNAVNEICVELFLKHKIRFDEIYIHVELALGNLNFQAPRDFEEIKAQDAEARQWMKSRILVD